MSDQPNSNLTPQATAAPTGAEIEGMWYLPPIPPAPRGWLVFSEQFVLATLQGTSREPERAVRTPGWRAAAGVIRLLMAVGQAVIMLLSWVPVVSWFMETLARTFTRNSAGFFLRACYWKAKLRSLGQDTLIDQGVDIWGGRNVSIGSCCHIDTNVRMSAGEKRHGQHGSIVIGDYVHIGPHGHVAGRGGVEIHDLVSLSARVHLYSASNTIENPEDPGQLVALSHVAPTFMQVTIEAPVVLEELVFIGAMTRIFPGVRIGRGAIVHGGCELTRNVPPFSNVGGVPRGRQIGWRRPRRPSPKLKQRGEGS